jgi:hypothetical protein
MRGADRTWLAAERLLCIAAFRWAKKAKPMINAMPAKKQSKVKLSCLRSYHD